MTHLQLSRASGDASVSGAVTLVNETKDTFDLSGASLSTGSAQFAARWESVSEPLGPSGKRNIAVTWTPAAGSTSQTAVLTVQVAGYTLTSTIQGTVVP
jgi:hypothetical protein